jgi:hypothetical protein
MPDDIETAMAVHELRKRLPPPEPGSCPVCGEPRLLRRAWYVHGDTIDGTMGVMIDNWICEVCGQEFDE